MLIRHNWGLVIQDKRRIIQVKKKLLSVGLVLVLALSLCLVTAVPVAAGNTIPVGPAVKYPTIQAAIDAADPGDTIIVEPGTYDEDITINKSELTVVSLETHGALINAGGANYGVFIVSNNVTLDGFVIDNAKWGVQVDFGVANAVITNNRFADDPDMMAIYFNRGSGGYVENNEIKNLRKGMGFQTDEAVTVVSNLLKGCAVVAIEVFQDVEAVDNFAITGNVFEENARQVHDPNKILDLDAVLDSNTFDRAVVVRGSPIKVPTIFSSIQDAVNATVSGDAISVLPGIYPEDVVIPVSDLQLLGAKAGFPAGPDASPANRGTDESVIEGRIWDGGSTTGSTIDGFTILSGDLHGITLEGEDTVVNNIIEGSGANPTTTHGGVWSGGGGGHFIANNNIQGYVSGMVFDGGIADPQCVVTENYITNCSMVGIQTHGSWSNGHIFADNLIEGNGSGIVLAQGEHQVSGNRILNNEGTGVYIFATVRTYGIEVTHNLIAGNGRSIRLYGDDEYAVDNVAHFNDIVGNRDRLVNEFTATFDANYNWWGDISGPNCPDVNPSGIGDVVGSNVDIAPWLTREFQQVLDENIAYFGFPWVHVGLGWNLLSTPIALDPVIGTWGEYIELGNGLAVNPKETTYYFDGVSQWYVQVLPDYVLKPCDAIIVNMFEPDMAAICYSPVFSNPSKDLVAGWNLVSLSSKSDMWVDVALASIEEVTGGLKGYAQVLSPNMNQSSWVYVPGEDTENMLKTKGYWVFMVNGGTLAGFESTPQTLSEVDGAY